MKTLIFTTILLITSLTSKAQGITACRGTNDSIEIHGGVGPYTWITDSLHFLIHTDCNNAIYNVNNYYPSQIQPTTTTSIIFYTGYNTTIKPHKIASVSSYQIGGNISICPTTGLQIANVYPIRIYDVNGDSLIINNASELQYPTATITTIDESSSLFCDGSANATLSIGAVSEWLSGNSVLSITDSVTNLCPGMYVLNLVDTIGCENTYSLTINAGPIPNTQPICLITVDQTNTHNLLVWDKADLESSVDSVVIYRKVGSPYVRIGAVHRDSLSTFDDYLANPNVTGYRYKLTAKNAAGVESDLSMYHNTIYLTNNGANFNWTAYQIEGSNEPVASYNLWRDDNSTGNFQMIVSTDGTQNGFTDINYSQYPNASYYVEAIMVTGDCNPTRIFSGARSNTKYVGLMGVESANKLNINIYPNPATTELNIHGISGETDISIYDSLGKLVVKEQIRKDTKIDVGGLGYGVYTVVTEKNTGRTYNKVVITY